MSFEGFYQVICGNHHLHEVSYSYDIEPIEFFDCPECGATAIWINLIDDTNCENVGLIELPEINGIVTTLPEKDQGRWPDQDPWGVKTITLEQLDKATQEKSYLLSQFNGQKQTIDNVTVELGIENDVLRVATENNARAREYKVSNILIILMADGTIFISQKEPMKDTFRVPNTMLVGK